jgi:putative glutamine amidotransferase
MKTVLLTQRVMTVESYQERRDCLDQAWYGFIEDCGFLPVPVPNHQTIAETIASRLNPSAMIFTGGNDLIEYGGDAPERDATEKCLLEHAVAKSIPVLGVCRGMQFLHCYFGGMLRHVEGHTGTCHQLIFDGKKTEVNSYHRFAFDKPLDVFFALAISEDGIVEAMKHKNLNISGIMWHPEREKESNSRDICLIRNLIQGDER